MAAFWPPAAGTHPFPPKLRTKGLTANAFLVGLAVATAWVVGCSAGAGTTGGGLNAASVSADSTGSVALQLTLPGGAVVRNVNYSITDGPTPVSGTIDVTSSNTASTLVAGIVPGTYTVTLTATSVDGNVTCLGTATHVIVTARATAVADINLVCQETDAGNTNGSVLINGTLALCPMWQSISTDVSETTTGNSSTISFKATGPNATAISYSATVEGGVGTLSSTSGTAANDTPTAITFTCGEVGTATIQIVFSDGPAAVAPEAGACPPSDTTPPAVTIKCDATNGRDAGEDTGVADTGIATSPVDSGAGEAAPDANAEDSAMGTMDNTGSVDLEVSLAGGGTITAVSYDITGPSAASGTIDVTRGDAASTLVGGLAPGGGYAATVTATSVDGTTMCLGVSLPFTVIARATTTVPVQAVCQLVNGGGSDAAADTGTRDAGLSDTGTPDAGAPDTGAPDSGGLSSQVDHRCGGGGGGGVFFWPWL